jgi:serine/threonine protein kinase
MENNEISSTPLLGKRYQLQMPLATGGMAIVYKAQDLWLERPVAIKVLRQDYSSDVGFRQRFHHEAKAAANLTHPNIVTIFDFGLDDENLFIVMEYVPGKDLKSLLRIHGPYSPQDALPLVIQACAGVGYAHRSGIIHCDIKPQNLLVSPDKRLKVTDFGIARALASIPPEEKNDIVWGSPQYFSPEQASGLAPSPASDVYSIGVILYELLTGRLPFTANDPIELARMHREAKPVPPHRYIAQTPPALEQILLKILSKEPSARYRTADQLGRVLQNYLDTPDMVKQTRKANIISPIPEAENVSKPQLVVDQSTFQDQQFPNTNALPENPFNVDWITTSLGLLCTLAVGGLIPLWLYIWFTLRSFTP